MAAEQTNGTPRATIQATYGSSNGSKTFTQPVDSSPPTDTKSKPAYFNSLRSATKSLQDDINTFLTAKMEEDKQAADHTSGNKNKSRDEEEEENYGEEKVEDN